MSLSIDLYCNDGSPLNISPTDINGRGVGGAELAMMTWAETMASRGHKVRVYNNPPTPGNYGGVEYLPQNDFAFREGRDVFIAFRSPNRYTRIAKAAVKLFWSTDQYTVGDFARDIFPYVDRTICISPFHVDYHIKRYVADPEQIGYFDLGVRVEDYEQEIEKIPGRCIYCSVPERGLEVLRLLWPQIKERVPGASMIITSDYTLWGSPNPLNQEHRLRWLHLPDVEFVGNIPRPELVKEQLKAVCQPYPCNYSELFCISAAECQIAGAYPVTSSEGALTTTNQWGTVIRGNILDGDWQKKFVSAACAQLETAGGMAQAARQKAKARFDWHNICSQWEQLIATGEYATAKGRPHELTHNQHQIAQPELAPRV